MRQLMAGFQSFRHPTRPQQQQQQHQSQAPVAQPSVSVPDGSLPPRALLCLLHDMLDLLRAEEVVCSAARLPNKYCMWLGSKHGLSLAMGVMDDVLPAWRKPGEKDTEHKDDGWAGVEKLLAALGATTGTASYGVTRGASEHRCVSGHGSAETGWLRHKLPTIELNLFQRPLRSHTRPLAVLNHTVPAGHRASKRGDSAPISHTGKWRLVTIKKNAATDCQYGHCGTLAS